MSYGTILQICINVSAHVKYVKKRRGGRWVKKIKQREKEISGVKQPCELWLQRTLNWPVFTVRFKNPWPASYQSAGTRTHTHRVTHIPKPTTYNVNASEREDCSWLRSDQGVFPAFFKMDSDFFTFQLLSETVYPLCAAKRRKVV